MFASETVFSTDCRIHVGGRRHCVVLIMPSKSLFDFALISDAIFGFLVPSSSNLRISKNRMTEIVQMMHLSTLVHIMFYSVW